MDMSVLDLSGEARHNAVVCWLLYQILEMGSMGQQHVDRLCYQPHPKAALHLRQ